MRRRPILYESYLGDERPVELRETGGSEAFDLAQRRRRIVEQRLDVDALAPRRKRREIPRTARQQVDGAVMIQAAELIERDADLQDALVEIADVATLGAPEQLEGLVLLEEFAAIELLDAFEELRRRGLVAGHFFPLLRGPIIFVRGGAPPPAAVARRTRLATAQGCRSLTPRTPRAHALACWRGRRRCILVEMIEKRRSKIHGWGVYATERIPKNTRIIDYAGEKISNQESLRRELRYIKHGHIWCFKLTNRRVIDAGVGGNVARFINHSCQPNCYIHIVDGTIWIRAARPIRKGEELTYNYNTDGEGLIKCRCRAGCQKLL